MSRVAFRFQYTGSALEAGLMDVRDLAPALLALGNLCEQANYEVNPGEIGARVQIRAVSPGSFNVDFWLQVGLMYQVATSLGLNPITSAKDVFELVKTVIETAKTITGAVTDVVNLENGSTRVTIEHKHTHDVSDRVYGLLTRPAIQDDIRRIVAPLRHEGVDALNIIQNGKPVETVTTEDLSTLDNLPRALPSKEPEVIEQTSTIERWFKVISLSSESKYKWRFSDGGPPFPVKVDDKHLYEEAKAGHLGIEPGFLVKARIRSETRFEKGEAETENHLLEILEVKRPTNDDDKKNRLL
jgi:hypothetical protein